MIDTLAAEKRARESVRKCRTVLGMVLDYSGAIPNAARDRRLKLPLAEPDEVEPPHADHVEAAAWLLTPSYLIGLLVLDATGARVGEVAAATIGDLDETRNAWLVRAKVAKTRRARGSNSPRISSVSSSSGYPREKIETRKRPSSRSSRQTVCAWRSAARAVMRRCPLSVRTIFVTGESVCFITRV
jgi:integrase